MTDSTSGPIAGIDHALVGVGDLEGARETWERLGFTLTPRGSHIGWGTANYCIMFASDYVELLGVVDPTQFTNRLAETLAEWGEGLLGLALATPDAQAAHEALDLKGISGGTAELARRLELPDGPMLPRFRLVHLAPAATPGLSAFLCQHLDRPLLWRRAWTLHPNAAIAVEGLTVVVPDTRAAAPAWRALFGSDAVFEAAGRLDVAVGRGQMLRLLTPERFARRYEGLDMPPVPAGPRVLTIRCTDLLATRAVLKDRGIPMAPVRGARLVVPPEVANGVVLEFAVS